MNRGRGCPSSGRWGTQDREGKVSVEPKTSVVPKGVGVDSTFGPTRKQDPYLPSVVNPGPNPDGTSTGTFNPTGGD